MDVGDVPSPDGQYAYQGALRAENAAFAEYSRVLRIFSDLVLHGKMPEEPVGGEEGQDRRH